MEEIWKDIGGFEGYQASNLGRVKSIKRKSELIMKERLNERGYLTVKVRGKPRYIHQLVAIAFLNHIPCELKLVVNHINFIKTDNRLENLEIVTQRVNANLKHINSSSSYVGVYWHKHEEKWCSSILVNGKRKYIGYFNNELEASEYYENALKAIEDGTEIQVNKKISSSKYKGVSWNKRVNKWVAYITIGGKYKHVGYFITEEDAANSVHIVIGAKP